MNDHHPLVLTVTGLRPIDGSQDSHWFHTDAPDLLIALANQRLKRHRHIWPGLRLHTFCNRRLWLDLRGSPLNFQ